MIAPSVSMHYIKLPNFFYMLNVVDFYGGTKIEFWCESVGLHGCSVPSEGRGTDTSKKTRPLRGKFIIHGHNGPVR